MDRQTDGRMERCGALSAPVCPTAHLTVSQGNVHDNNNNNINNNNNNNNKPSLTQHPKLSILSLCIASSSPLFWYRHLCC